MKHSDKVVASFQARDVSKMKFKADYQNIYTDAGIRAIETAKEKIKRQQMELNQHRALVVINK
ncbi:hypothetical protein ACRPH4_05640 [Pantoea allii]|uniref:hypothetical protein n=1 Tax=Pantoea allii TaxID=574096 RepID=UPI003D7B3DE7